MMTSAQLAPGMNVRYHARTGHGFAFRLLHDAIGRIERIVEGQNFPVYVRFSDVPEPMPCHPDELTVVVGK